MERFRYTDNEIKELVKSLVVLVDTREKKHQHVVEGIEKQGFKWQSKALNAGDFSCYLPKNEALGLARDVYFDKSIMIERKADLNELSGNLAQKRQQFENEMLRANEAEKHLIIEYGSWEQIIKGGYTTGLQTKAFYHSLLSFSNKYGLKIHFMPSSLTAIHILALLGIHVQNRYK